MSYVEAVLEGLKDLRHDLDRLIAKIERTRYIDDTAMYASTLPGVTLSRVDGIAGKIRFSVDQAMREVDECTATK